MEAFETLFKAMDVDGSGGIDKAEFEAYFRKKEALDDDKGGAG